MENEVPALAPKHTRPGVLLTIAAVCAVVVSMFLGFLAQRVRGGGVPESIGAGTSQFIMAGVVALLFSISPKFRNPLSRTRIVLYTSLVLIAVTIGNLGRGSEILLERAAREINADTPRIVDETLRIDGASTGPGLLLTIKLTRLDIAAADLEQDEFKSNAAAALRQQAESNPWVRRILESGIELAYQYFGRDGKKLGEVRLTRDHLPGARHSGPTSR